MSKGKCKAKNASQWDREPESVPSTRRPKVGSLEGLVRKKISDKTE